MLKWVFLFSWLNMVLKFFIKLSVLSFPVKFSSFEAQIYFRSVLDFDFEKLCTVSLSHLNVYACLVCGKYFQGEFIYTSHLTLNQLFHKSDLREIAYLC